MSRHMNNDGGNNLGQDIDYGRDQLPDADLDDVSAFWTSEFDPVMGAADPVEDAPGVFGPVEQLPPRRTVYLGPDVEYGGMPLDRKRHSALVVGVPLLALLLCVLMFVFSVLTVWGQVGVVKDSLSGLVSGMKAGDNAVVVQKTDDLVHAADVMRHETGSPVWGMACAIPFVGADLANARDLAVVLDDVATNGLEPMSDKLAGVSLGSLLQDGAINVQAMQDLMFMLSDMAPVLDRAEETFASMQPGVIGPLNSAIAKGQEVLVPASSLADNAELLAEQLPSLLGADGHERRYLILAQSNAELRSVGGFPGSWGVLTVTDGRMEMGDFGSPSAIRQTLDVADDELAVYNSKTMDMVTSAGINPNFPRVGEITSQIYGLESEESGKTFQSVDGVIAVDPIFLQELMKLTNGSVKTRDYKVDGSNTAEFILSRIYWDVSVGKQDVLFAKIAKKAFDLVVHGLDSVDLADFARLIQDGAANRHLTVWFADPDLEEVMRIAGIAGAVHTDPREPYLGVYVNDFTWSKMSWYLNCVTEIGNPQSNEDGTKTYHVTTKLENHITPEEVEKAPKYVLGAIGNENVKKPGQMLVYVLLYAPAGGKLANVTIDNPECLIGKKEFEFGTTSDLSIATALPRLDPQQGVLISYDVTVSSDAEEELQLDTTPTAQNIADWKTFS